MENILKFGTSIVQNIYKPVLAGACLLFVGISTQHVIVRSPVRPLVIQMSLNEPPRIAFMLSRKISQHDIEKEFQINSEAKPLSALREELSQGSEEIKYTLQPMVLVANEDFRKKETQVADAISQEELENIKAGLPPGLRNRLEMARLQETGVLQSAARSPANIPSEKFKLEGLPYFPGYQFEVKIVQDGVASSEAAKIDPHSGDIFFNSSSLGDKIIVQLRDDKGRVIGEGQKINGGSAKSNPIVIKPTRDHVTAGRGPINYERSKGQLFAQNVATSKSEKIDVLDLGEYYRGSWVNLRSEADDKANSDLIDTIVFLEAGKPSYIPHPEKKTVQALKDYVSSVYVDKSTLISQGEVVIGQVEGSNVAGMQIEVVGAPQAVVQYFSIFPIPDQNAKGTSSNGYFSVFGLEPGSYQLLLKQGGQIVGFSNFTTEQNAVTAVMVKKMTDMISKNLISYDAFSGSPTSAQFGFQFSETTVQVDGKLQWLQASSSSPTFTSVLPSSSQYLPMTVCHNNNVQEILAPQVTYDWINNLQQAKQISQDPQNGLAILFFSESTFDLELLDHPNFENQNIVYFDFSGNPVDQPVIGGGVLMFNLPGGISNLRLFNSELEFNYVTPILGRSGVISTIVLPL